MTLTKEAKLEIIGRHGRSKEDTGSPEVQIALLTTAHQRADRAPAHAPEGPLLAPRPAEAGRAATAVPELPPAKERRGLPRIDQGAGPKALARIAGGWKFERAPSTRGSCPKPPLSTKKWRTDEHDDGKPRHGLGDRRRARDHLRDREAGQAGRRLRRRQGRRHDGAGDRRRADGRPRGRGLLPAHGRRRGADVRRREDPRRFLQARGPPHRAGDPDRAHDRPPDPAALAEGLQERGARGLHDAVGRPRHRARHPLHQRRLGRADGLAAALPGPGGRRPDRTGRRRVRRQPDAAGRRGGEHARPDRRRHEGRADDDRGRRRRDPRGRDPRGVRARARRDREDLRRAGGPAPAGRQAEVPRPRAHLGARVAARRPDPRAHRGRRPARGGPGRRGARRRARFVAEHGVERGGHPPADPGSRVARRDSRARAARGRRAACARAVRGRPEGADRGRAGLEGAQVGEAPAALRPDHRGGRAAVPGRPGHGRGRGRRRSRTR